MKWYHIHIRTVCGSKSIGRTQKLKKLTAENLQMDGTARTALRSDAHTHLCEWENQIPENEIERTTFPFHILMHLGSFVFNIARFWSFFPHKEKIYTNIYNVVYFRPLIVYFWTLFSVFPFTNRIYPMSIAVDVHSNERKHQRHLFVCLFVCFLSFFFWSEIILWFTATHWSFFECL